MARIAFEGVAHSYHGSPDQPEDYALKSMDFTWEDGVAYALLGPSGCGKTTLLNIISGLIHPIEGRVFVDSVEVTELPTERRNVAQVFQFPVVYDTMTVFDNLAFPLRNRGIAESEVRDRVLRVAEVLELTDELKHRARGLTGDAKQKISLGRGLVRHDVAVILFDEPITVIDPHIKWRLRRKLKELHHEFDLTMIYVTHDQNEALTFADQVLVMNEGRVVQTGSPRDLFEHPAHTFVGDFIGNPGMNLLPCRVDGAGVQVSGNFIALDPDHAERARNAQGTLELGIRPEFVRYLPHAESGYVPAKITDVEHLGNYQLLTARLGAQSFKAKVREDAAVARGTGWFAFPPEWTRLYADGDVVR